MRFGPVVIDEAEGAILAHALSIGTRRFKKGHRLEAVDLRAIAAAGVNIITVAALDASDIEEDPAAEGLARKIAGAGTTWRTARTGRANLFAESDGLFVVNEERVHELNAVDEAITLATLPPFSPVRKGTMLATIKIIPFAVEHQAIERAFQLLAEPVCRVAPFAAKEVRLIQTTLPGTPEKLLDKTAAITAARLQAVSARLLGETRCAHDAIAIADAIDAACKAGFDILLIAGASAITDRADAMPDAILQAGGHIERFGMPVDPGNLLLLASLDGKPVIGLPGCARSPKLNGFDWILERLAAGLPVGPAEIRRMGVGGLLTEIPSRPEPRDDPESMLTVGADIPVAAVILAAGRSTRMGSANKLLTPFRGMAMVRHAALSALASRADPVLVVTGHEAQPVEDALSDLRLSFVHNPDYPDGLSTSLRAAIEALPEETRAILVLLGDMPLVTTALIERLIAAFDPQNGRTIVVPVSKGRRGNPILLGRRHFADILRIEGDIGARDLIAAHPEAVSEVTIDDEGALLDVDTPAALSALRSREDAS